MGPMAEDFHEAFGLDADEEHITTVDADGVALAAIQGLAERLNEENRRLRERVADLEARFDEMVDDADRAAPADD